MDQHAPSILPLGIALLMGAATFIAVNPPPAFRVIRYDVVSAALAPPAHDLQDPCPTDNIVKHAACRKAHLLRARKPAPPLQIHYKMADPFWDRA